MFCLQRNGRKSCTSWNKTGAEYSRDKCIHELFEEEVRKRPEAVALVTGEECLTYGELNRRANRVAHHLRKKGVKADARVAICLERSLEMVVAIVGVLKAGGGYVPLDPDYPVERLRFMLQDSTPSILITQRHLRELFPRTIQAILPVLDLTTAFQEELDTDLDRDAVGLTSERVAYVIYTSGSTGPT